MTDTVARLLSFPTREDDRLRLALRGLVAALEAQGEAVAALRGELSGLSSTMQDLDSSFSTYRAELNTTSTATRQAGDEARRLERTAEDWLSATRV